MLKEVNFSELRPNVALVSYPDKVTATGVGGKLFCAADYDTVRRHADAAVPPQLPQISLTFSFRLRMPFKDTDSRSPDDSTVDSHNSHNCQIVHRH